MVKRSGTSKVVRIPHISSYHSELQKRVAIVGVSLVIILVLVGIGLYVSPGKFVGKAIHSGTDIRGEQNLGSSIGVETLTYTWDGTDWALVGRPFSYCSSTNFCVGAKAPRHDTFWLTPDQLNTHCSGNFCEDDTYCYEAGSILYDNLNIYCSPSYGGRNYVWISCERDTRYYLTEDSTFICDDTNGATDGGYQWTQCTEEGEVRGEYRCNGNTWELCGDGSDYLCADSASEQCNEDTQFDINQEVGVSGAFYCSYTSGTNYKWVECTDETVGEGVDNADNANRYGDNYVCSVSGSGLSIDYAWEPITNCAACAGNLPGSCVGSSRVNFRTGEPIAKYYSGYQVNTRIGCAAVNECYHGGREYAIDELFSASICGDDNSFLLCTDGAVAIRSDGGALLCRVDTDEDELGNGIWDRCTEEDAGVQIDNFICSFNAAENKWQWYSEFSCSEAQAYQIRDRAYLTGTDRICGQVNPLATPAIWEWLTCEDQEAGHPFFTSDPDVEVMCTAGGQITVIELICNNNDDDDNDGLLNCADGDCADILNYALNETENYEVVLKNGDCFDVDINVSYLPPLAYDNLNVCDTGTAEFGNRVTLCQEVSGSNDIAFPSLDSTSLLQNRFGQPYVDANNLAFLFAESVPKTVSVMLYRDISTAALELPLATFAPNFVAEQRVMLGVDDESYLLWHPAITAAAPFDEANLKLTHIATGTEIPAIIYPGTNRYTFDIPGDRLVTFLVDTEIQVFHIEALPPGEAPQSYPVPTNLYERFEVTFSNASPIRFIEPADLGIFSICRDDNDADPQQVKVCRDDNLEFTLKRGNLTKRMVERTNYAFLFEVVGSTKQVSLFNLTLLNNIPPELTYDTLTYDPFINAMVAGRRAAVEFEHKLYLLKHPITAFISLPSITLTRYTGDITTTFPAIGSPDAVDFLIPDGKVSLERKYGDPPPPFQISALRTEQIAPVNLDLHLSTSMSSLVPVTITNPDLGVIRAADSVYRLDEQVFNINVDGTSHLLHLAEAEVLTDNLFYYHTVTPSEGALLKQVSIYKLYDLTSGSTSRAYNAEFVEQFAGGKEFAILLGGQYYLARYENNNNEVLSFNINRVRLSTLDRTTSFVAIPDGTGVRFDLPDGKRVRIQVNYGEDTLEMQTGLELLTEIPFTGYMTEINPSNEVKINTTANFRMCYLTAYALLPGARVCDTVGTSDIDALANPLTVVPGDESYVLEVNGQTGNDKRVFVRNLTAIPLSPAKYEIDDWFNFVGELVAHREPYFQVDDRLYVPQATDGRLETFRLKQYPDGTPQAPRNIRVKTPLTTSGSIVMNDRVIVVDQQETRDEERPVEASFMIQPYYYLPDNHEAIRFNSTGAESISFVFAVDGTQYTLRTSAPSTSLVRLSLSANQDPPSPLLNRLFAAGETRVLNLEGAQVEIKVESIFNREAQITVKRR